MSLSKHEYMPTYDFPEEILSEVFKRLPVKYVLRCGAVQKSWYSLVKSPMFVTLHLNHQKMTAHDNPKYLLMYVHPGLIKVCFDDAQCQEYCTLKYPFDLNNHEWSASSNGLICISSLRYRRSNYDPSIYIWNPLVQKCRLLPDSPLSRFTLEEIEWNDLAFGFLPEVNDYVVLHIVKLQPDPDDPDARETAAIGIYSLNTSSWKLVFHDGIHHLYNLRTDQSVFVNGTAFWVVEDDVNQFVLYFDTKKEIIRNILVPDWFELQDRLEHPVIHPFGQSIAYFVENDESHHLDIWVLKEDMVDEFSWEKKMSVSLSENIRANVLGIRNNGDPILAISNNLISYDLDTHEPYDFVNYEEGFKHPYVITPFVETLLWRDMK